MVFLSAVMSAYLMSLATATSNVKYVDPMQGTAKDPRINAIE